MPVPESLSSRNALQQHYGFFTAPVLLIVKRSWGGFIGTIITVLAVIDSDTRFAKLCFNDAFRSSE